MKITKGFIVACMECHQQIGTAVDTHGEAERQAEIHFSAKNKLHDGALQQRPSVNTCSLLPRKQ